MERQQKKLLKLLEDDGTKLHALLYRLTLRYDVTEDLMQEMSIKLFSYKGLDEIENIGHYARRVAINLAFDWRRKQAKKCVSLDQVSEACSKADAPIKKVIRQERVEELLSAVSRLRGAHREVVVLRYLEQVSYEDIGAQIGKTPHYVRTICHRARRQLRRSLSSNDPESVGFELESCNG